jgi:DNA-directed RNA polymerase subunit M/transcription elongation factor TFIIS
MVSERDYTEKCLEYLRNNPPPPDSWLEYCLQTYDTLINRKKVVLESNFSCPQCSSRNVQSSQHQIRSADEGSTTLFVCRNCSHKWFDF